MKLPHWARQYIIPLRIPTPFAVGDVFSYLIKDRKTVLVDCGPYTDEAQEHLKQLLNEEKIAVTDLDEIWLTHGHPDHYGQAAHLADLSGAAIYGHAKEQANFTGNKDQALFLDFFKKHHIPQLFIEQMMEQLQWLQQFSHPIEPDRIDDGSQLSSGRLTVTVKLTPGHAPGHLVFDTGEGIIFGGDLLLGHISTNALINFDPGSGERNRSLLQYRKSLQWIAGKEGLVLPGHGDCIHNIRRIAQRHLREHNARYRNILKRLEEQPMTLMGIAQQLFADAIEEGSIFLVLSEVMGYLDWGIAEGAVIERQTANGIIFKKH
jgi:glyoxylase-like metal-dependent hydrolase (beta-lactamase superfamily II)